MAKHFRNRAARCYRELLEAWGFKWTSSNGDDAIYTKPGAPIPIKIPSRDNEGVPIGTGDYIKKCLIKDGYTRKQILDWWEQNGY